MVSVIAFIKVFAVLVILVLAMVIIAKFLYRRFFNKIQYIEKENFVSILRQGNVKDVIVAKHSSDRMVAGDGGYYTL